jgi:ParB family chromosome partitioning protein
MSQDSTRFLPIDQISPNPLQPRGTITSDSLQDLMDSIKEHGVLEPLIIAETPAGLQIIAGERRWRASKLAGLTEVPVIIKQTTPKGMLEMALVENVQRSDLNPIERAKAFDRLINEFGLTPGDLAKRISKSPAYVSNSLRMLTLPDILKDGLLTGMITEGHARALSSIDNYDLIIDAYKIILKESGSVRRAEELARRMKTKVSNFYNIKRPPLIVSKDTDKIKDDILNKLNQIEIGHKNNVKLSRSRSETKLIIHLKGNPENTENRLQAIYHGLLNYNNKS